MKVFYMFLSVFAICFVFKQDYDNAKTIANINNKKKTKCSQKFI